MGFAQRPNHHILWFERVRASVAKEAIRCNGHLILLIFAGDVPGAFERWSVAKLMTPTTRRPDSPLSEELSRSSEVDAAAAQKLVESRPVGFRPDLRHGR